MANSGEQIVKRELRAGEKLLWSGQPRTGIRLRYYDILLIPFSLMWGGVAIFWEVMVILVMFFEPFKKDPPPLAVAIVFPLLGMVHVAVGLYMIFGRFLVDAKGRAGTYYALTDQRVIIISTLLRHKVQSLSLRHLPEITLQQSRDGSGTLSFTSPGVSNPLGIVFWPGLPQAIRFEMLAEARAVFDLIHSAQQRAYESSPYGT